MGQEDRDWLSERKTAKSEADERVRKLSRAEAGASGRGYSVVFFRGGGNRFTPAWLPLRVLRSLAPGGRVLHTEITTRGQVEKV